MLAEIKRTVGRISRYGVIPITADQDTAGSLAKSVTDAAIMLGALGGAAAGPKCAATSRCTPGRDYTRFLKVDGLKGARIGIPRTVFYTVREEGRGRGGRGGGGGGLNAEQAKVMADAIEILKKQGAIVVDVEIPSMASKDPSNSFSSWGQCGGA